MTGLITFVSISTTIFVGSFANPNITKVEIKPEWNGPDLLITYQCGGTYKKLPGLRMEKKGNKITVNYGALGRRGFLNNDFKCDTPMYTHGSAVR